MVLGPLLALALACALLGVTSVKATVQQTFTPTELLAGADLGTSGISIPHAGLNQSVNLTGTSTPPISACAFPTVTLATGAAALDLTACAGGTNGTTVNFTGLKVCAVQVVAPKTNLNPITITPGGSNPYLLLGTGFSVTLRPGDSQNLFFFGTTPAVAAGAKALAFAGTGSGDQLQLGIGAG